MISKLNNTNYLCDLGGVSKLILKSGRINWYFSIIFCHLDCIYEIKLFAWDAEKRKTKSVCNK